MSFATGAALFVGITQIWLLSNQNKLIEQQTEFVELQGFSSRVQAVQLILDGYKVNSDASLAIAQLESLGDEGFRVLLSLSTSDSPLNKLAMESLVEANIAISDLQKTKVYTALAGIYAEKARYHRVESAGDAYYYLKLLDKYLEKTELGKNQKLRIPENELNNAKSATREVGIVSAHFRLMNKNQGKKYAEAIRESEYYRKESFFDEDGDVPIDLSMLFFNQSLISVTHRLGSWCHLEKGKYLPEILIENYRTASKQRNETSVKDHIVSHRDPWLFENTCQNINLFAYHEDSGEQLSKEIADVTIYLDEK